MITATETKSGQLCVCGDSIKRHLRERSRVAGAVGTEDTKEVEQYTVCRVTKCRCVRFVPQT